VTVSGANDVFNSQGEAAWSNRIPIAARALLEAIAVSSDLLPGYAALSDRIGPAHCHQSFSIALSTLTRGEVREIMPLSR
jgi:hypothetical protein